MRARDTNGPGDGRADAETLALSALVWVLSDPAKAERLLALTGLDAAGLRARATDPSLLAAVLGFLAGHEADLTTCADAIAVRPETLIAAQATLET